TSSVTGSSLTSETWQHSRTSGPSPKTSSTSSSSSSGLLSASMPSITRQRQVPQLAERQEKGTSASGCSSHTSTSAVPGATSTSKPEGRKRTLAMGPQTWTGSPPASNLFPAP